MGFIVCSELGFSKTLPFVIKGNDRSNCLNALLLSLAPFYSDALLCYLPSLYKGNIPAFSAVLFLLYLGLVYTTGWIDRQRLIQRGSIIMSSVDAINQSL